jgi:hypothetical protein
MLDSFPYQLTRMRSTTKVNTSLFLSTAQWKHMWGTEEKIHAFVTSA